MLTAPPSPWEPAPMFAILSGRSIIVNPVCGCVPPPSAIDIDLVLSLVSLNREMQVSRDAPSSAAAPAILVGKKMPVTPRRSSGVSFGADMMSS